MKSSKSELDKISRELAISGVNHSESFAKEIVQKISELAIHELGGLSKSIKDKIENSNTEEIEYDGSKESSNSI